MTDPVIIARVRTHPTRDRPDISARGGALMRHAPPDCCQRSRWSPDRPPPILSPTPTPSSRATRAPARWASRCSRTGSRSGRGAVGRGRRGRGGHAVLRDSRTAPTGCSCCAAGSRPRGAGGAARRRRGPRRAADGIVDAQGRAAAHTGSRCIVAAATTSATATACRPT